MYKFSKKFVKKWSKLILLLFFGIILNMFFNDCANTYLKKLLFLDSIGTMVAAAIGGYFPGVLVALSTNIIFFVTAPPSVYYVVLNILIALTVTFIVRIYQEKKVPFIKLFVPWILLVSLCDSFLGSIITYAQGNISPHHDGMIDNIVIFFMDNYGLNFFVAHFISNFFVHLVDKSLSAIVAILIIKFFPAGLKNDIRNIGWLQKPLSSSELKKITVPSWRKMSVKTKIIIGLSLTCIAITLVISIMSRMLFVSYMEDKYKEEAQGISRLIASTIEPDRVDSYIRLGENAAGYTKTENLLYNVSYITPNIHYIFVYKVSEDGYTVVFDLDTEETKGEDPGTHVDFDKSVYPYVDKMIAGEEFDPYITDDENIGYFLTSLSPVYDSSGNCICYAGVDVSMEDFQIYEKQFLLKLLSLCAGFMIMIITAGLWFSEYHIIYPVNTIVKTADAFDYSGESARIQNVENVRNLSIHTGDEIENLYFAFLQTIEENMINYSSMLQKSKDLDEVQTKLIMVLADLVENRDSSTGDHIRKTATYTGIIMYKMREMGYYTDVLTDEYIDSVIKSAPLHDIGKIRISDSILNKPGKLTDEEFEIMKQHTTYGAQVIEQCISTLSGSNFLGEAKNIAKYHHEKWNGKGYPEGLSGEDIPLSARIMAVADVFDALISKRVYKDAFSFDKAMEIIKEDSGTHFDPKVAEAFLAASAQVREAARRFQN